MDEGSDTKVHQGPRLVSVEPSFDLRLSAGLWLSECRIRLSEDSTPRSCGDGSYVMSTRRDRIFVGLAAPDPRANFV